MVKHPFTEIRRAASDLLKTRFSRVYNNRLIAPAESQLPCAVVYIDGRGSEGIGIDTIYRHSVELSVVLCVRGVETADELAESMLREVELLFYRHTDLNTDAVNIQNIEPVNLNITYDDGGETVVAFYRQIWRLTYFECPDVE